MLKIILNFIRNSSSLFNINLFQILDDFDGANLDVDMLNNSVITLVSKGKYADK
jgi:hypothetical protein